MKPRCYKLITKLLLFNLLPITAANIYAQNRVCDSIVHLPVSRAHVDLLLEQTIYKKELKEYALKALEWSEEVTYPDGLMHSLDQIGVMERNMSHFAEALYYHNRCLAIAEIQQAEHWLMRSYINMGVVYRRIDQYETALTYFLKAFSLAKKMKNEREIASCLGNIGTLYLSLNKFDEAMESFRNTLYKAIEQNNYQGLAISYGSMGKVYEHWNQLDSAQYCYEQNLFYSKGWNDDNGIAISYNSLGNVAKKRGDWQKALEYYDNALEISIKIDDRNYIVPHYASKGDVYLHLGNMELAEKNYLQSFRMAQEAGLKTGMIAALGGLSNVYAQQSRYKEALRATKEQSNLKDSVLNEENLRRIEFLKISFEVEQKEAQIERQQHLISKQNLQRSLLAGGVALSVLILVLLWYLLHLRNRRNLALTERNDILLEMNTTKDKFFSIISHDLKNPALAQRDALLLLVKNAQTWDADTLTEYYHELLKSAEGEVELVYHLLNWAQLQTGRMSYNPTTFNLLARLGPDLSLIRKMAESKQITFHTHIPEDLFITADSDMITTVIRNLLTNSIKFTPSLGTVSLHITPTHSSDLFRTGAFRQAQCDHTPPAHIISIQDTGTGIPPDHLRTLFSLDRPKGTYTGLGLIVCKDLLEKHGTTLHVQSEVGKGSTFWFTI